MNALSHATSDFIARHGREPVCCANRDCAEMRLLLATYADTALAQVSKGHVRALPAEPSVPRPQRPVVEA